MSEPFMGQIMCTGFGFAPRYWARCDGAKLSISQNQALFTLVGTYFGGDGSTNFALPDLRGRTPVGGGFPSRSGPSLPPYILGQVGGTETVTLSLGQTPQHTHMVKSVSAAAATDQPVGGVFADTTLAAYGPAANLVPLGAGPTTPVGSGAPHENMQPFLVVNMSIALYGTYPSRN
jgi:microcystin-dependent protein